MIDVKIKPTRKSKKTKSGSQRYKCNHCKKIYTPNPKERKYSKEVKRQAIKLYMEGNVGRAIGEIKNFFNKSPKARHYYSDSYSAYKEIYYCGTHT
ncbi:MAG: hypothetical protein K2I60_02660, partial [Oscillospiraceae bacterium]|nr:hypothetical protein [Oscillospiraceae bacterium]